MHVQRPANAMYRIIRFALTARKNVDGVRRFAVKWRRFKRPETRSDLRLCPHNRRPMMMNQADTRPEVLDQPVSGLFGTGLATNRVRLRSLSTHLALPARRNHITQKVQTAGQRTLYISVHDDEQPAEIFLRLKGSDCSSELIGLSDVITCLMSLALQYGAYR